jgi:hypothetical protein
LQILSKSQYVHNFYYAAIYAALGDKDRMYNYLDESLEKREYIIHEINYWAAFTPYYNEPKYKEVIRKMWTPLEDN